VIARLFEAAGHHPLSIEVRDVIEFTYKEEKPKTIEFFESE
jgi:hypothetical protein